MSWELWAIPDPTIGVQGFKGSGCGWGAETLLISLYFTFSSISLGCAQQVPGHKCSLNLDRCSTRGIESIRVSELFPSNHLTGLLLREGAAWISSEIFAFQLTQGHDIRIVVAPIPHPANHEPREPAARTWPGSHRSFWLHWHSPPVRIPEIYGPPFGAVHNNKKTMIRCHGAYGSSCYDTKPNSHTYKLMSWSCNSNICTGSAPSSPWLRRTTATVHNPKAWSHDHMTCVELT